MAKKQNFQQGKSSTLKTTEAALDDGQGAHLILMALCYRPCTLGDVLIIAPKYGVHNVRRTLGILMASGIIAPVNDDYEHYNYASLLYLTQIGQDVFARAAASKTLREIALLSNLAYAADVSVHSVMVNAHKIQQLLSICSALNHNRGNQTHVKRRSKR